MYGIIYNAVFHIQELSRIYAVILIMSRIIQIALMSSQTNLLCLHEQTHSNGVAQSVVTYYLRHIHNHHVSTLFTSHVEFFFFFFCLNITLLISVRNIAVNTDFYLCWLWCKLITFYILFASTKIAAEMLWIKRIWSDSWWQSRKANF